MLNGKCIILGVTGSIAAYKSANLASMLSKAHCDVNVIMTENAKQFITPLTFETLTKNKCITDTFDRDFKFDVKHISLAQKADLLIIAPASANIIAKLAYGIADDMLSTTALACKCRKIISPAMNTNMYNNEIVQDNIEKLKKYGFEIIEPASGMLACKDIGKGKMPEPETLYKYILKNIAFEKDMSGKKVLVTAGPTCESIDPVRYITNHSTGKMGYSIAEACMLRGAEVTLISGPSNLEPPIEVNTINIFSAEQMYNEVINCYKEMDFIFKAAAVADYRPINIYEQKQKKTDSDMSVPLIRTEDILKYIGNNKRDGQIICGFSMETENMIQNSKKKLLNKNADLIVANNLKTEGAGFGTDTNVITIITKDDIKEIPKLSKNEAAHLIIDEAIKLSNQI